MPFTNAERQRRYVDRLKNKAQGVTPEMIRTATRIAYEHWAVDEDDAIPWPAFLESCKKNTDRWRGFIPQEPDADYSEYGSDAEMMRAVANVMHVIAKPPTE